MPVTYESKAAFKIFTINIDFRTCFFRNIFYYLQSFRIIYSSNYGYRMFYNSCFFKGNFSNILSEEFFMVKTNICYNTDNEQDNICCIKPSSHSYFNHSPVNFFTCKIIKSHCSNKFKKSRLQVCRSYNPADVRCKFSHIIFRDRDIIYCYALGKADKMRRGKHAYLKAAFLED